MVDKRQWLRVRYVPFLCILCTGDRYVVVDCGGGTVDLTVHQIRLPEGHLKELYKASGKMAYNTFLSSFMQLMYLFSYLLIYIFYDR